MLQLFRNNNPFTVIILFIFAILVKLKALLHAQAPVTLPGHFVYNYILKLLGHVVFGNAFAYTLLAIMLLFAQALYINRISVRHKIFHKPTYIPAFAYLLVTSIYPPFNFFSNTLLINWFVLGGLDIILGLAQSHHPRKHIFNAAFLFSTAMVFQFSAIGYFMLFIIAFLMLRPFNFGEWSVAIMGYTTPIYFFICMLFLVDRLYLLHSWVHIGFSLPVHLHSVAYLVWALIPVFLLFVAGVYGMQLQLPRTSIYVRRNWIVITAYLFISIAIAICTDVFVVGMWLIIMPALGLFISHAFSLEKSKGFSNFMFYFSILLIIICQLAYK